MPLSYQVHDTFKDLNLDSCVTMPGNVSCAAPIESASQRLAIELALTAVLRSDQFRNSQRSSAFLRYVVEQTLQGRSEELKERTIGIAVFAKEDDYDTAADALVRVRANDVRRRLAQYYESRSPSQGIRIELRAGSYVPAFVLVHGPAIEHAVKAPEIVTVVPPQTREASTLMPPPMVFWQMAAPTAIALFLALVAIRFGVRSDDAYSRFWAHLLAHRNSIQITLNGGNRPGWISQDLASSALPFSEVAREWQVPIVFGTSSGVESGGNLRIDLRMEPQLKKASIVVGREGTGRLIISAPTLPAIQAAVSQLCSRQQFLLADSITVEP